MIKAHDDDDKDSKRRDISFFTFCYCVIFIDCHIVEEEYDLHCLCVNLFEPDHISLYMFPYRLIYGWGLPF